MDSTQATKALLKSYIVVVTHMESMAADKSQDQDKAIGMLRKITRSSFTTCMVVSCMAEGCNRDSTDASSSEDSAEYLKILNVSKEESLDPSLMEAAIQNGEATYMGVSLTNVLQGLQFFQSQS